LTNLDAASSSFGSIKMDFICSNNRIMMPKRWYPYQQKWKCSQR
jgi:hypothetical protein